MKEKSENRRAFPKFMLTLLGATALGGVLGLGIGICKGAGVGTETVAAGVGRVLRAVTPWGTPVCAAALGYGVLWLYRGAARKVKAWDGGDESEASEVAEQRLDWALLLSGVQLLITLFFFAAAVHYELPYVLYHIGVLIVSGGLVIFEQQKVVDLTKRMNPEKRGSVYDEKFQKKWLESCDESERRQIGQAAYHAYMITCRTCVWLWAGLMICNMVFRTGLMPSFAVLLVLGVLQVSYALECIRIEKRGGAD